MPQLVLISTMIVASWFLMQAVHESGHVLSGVLTGGEIERVVLHPLTISRTDLKRNPSPLLTCWSGPIIGCLVPILLWILAAKFKLRSAPWLRFFAGFCLIANGSYLAVGVKDGIGDAGDLIRHGASAWMLYLFGAITIPTGLWLWNGLANKFGYGPQAEPVTWHAALLSSIVLLLTVAMAVIVGGK